jgi:hypothetical protein
MSSFLTLAVTSARYQVPRILTLYTALLISMMSWGEYFPSSFVSLSFLLYTRPDGS